MDLLATPTIMALSAALSTAAAETGPCSPDVPLRTCYWNLLLVHPLERGLTFLASDLGLGAGLAIIVFTIAIRLILLPLTIQQLRSQKVLQRLQPEIKALQKKYGNDRAKVQEATMALYREHGYNPAMGCLPLLLQMPVLFAFYAALRNLGQHSEAFQQPWLWLHSLEQPDVFHIGPQGIGLGPGPGTNLPFILPILAAATQWVQQRMMTPPTDDPQQRMQNQMMQLMPLMVLWFGLSFSAGLALYWVTQNLVGIVQQYFLTGWGSLLPGRAAGSPAAAGAGTSSATAGKASSGITASLGTAGQPSANGSAGGRQPSNGLASSRGGPRAGGGAGAPRTPPAVDSSGGSPRGASTGGRRGPGRGKGEGRRASGKR